MELVLHPPLSHAIAAPKKSRRRHNATPHDTLPLNPDPSPSLIEKTSSAPQSANHKTCSLTCSEKVEDCVLIQGHLTVSF